MSGKPIPARPKPLCPCCGNPIAAAADLAWNADARTLSGNGLAILLSPHRAAIFNLAWIAWKTGRLVSREQMMSAVYADDASGGPESINIISVQVGHVRRAIEPFGITITARCGYSLTPLKREAA